jgi:protein ImuA
MPDVLAPLLPLARPPIPANDRRDGGARPVMPLGLPAVDALLNGGLLRGALHEVYAAGTADAAAATGLALAFARTLGTGRPLVWIRQDVQSLEAGLPYPPGLQEFGIDPAAIVAVRVRDALAALQAGLDAARSSAPGAVLIELWGEARAFDLTASRRLVLAAEASRTSVPMVRLGATPCPSAAETRWQAAPAPSRALGANAPGQPAFSVTLLRQRSGASGQHWRMEWNRDQGCFEDGSATRTAALRPGDAPPLSGGLVSLSGERPGTAESAGAAVRRTG